jgi:hypothetical protein
MCLVRSRCGVVRMGKQDPTSTSGPSRQSEIFQVNKPIFLMLRNRDMSSNVIPGQITPLLLLLSSTSS